VFGTIWAISHLTALGCIAFFVVSAVIMFVWYMLMDALMKLPMLTHVASVLLWLVHTVLGIFGLAVFIRLIYIVYHWVF
jgi:hypothetical protein